LELVEQTHQIEEADPCPLRIYWVPMTTLGCALPGPCRR
jgi:hypothetical protein